MYNKGSSLSAGVVMNESLTLHFDRLSTQDWREKALKDAGTGGERIVKTNIVDTFFIVEYGQ